MDAWGIYEEYLEARKKIFSFFLTKIIFHQTRHTEHTQTTCRQIFFYYKCSRNLASFPEIKVYLHLHPCKTCSTEVVKAAKKTRPGHNKKPFSSRRRLSPYTCHIVTNDKISSPQEDETESNEKQSKTMQSSRDKQWRVNKTAGLLCGFTLEGADGLVSLQVLENDSRASPVRLQDKWNEPTFENRAGNSTTESIFFFLISVLTFSYLVQSEYTLKKMVCGLSFLQNMEAANHGEPYKNPCK